MDGSWDSHSVDVMPVPAAPDALALEDADGRGGTPGAKFLAAEERMADPRPVPRGHAAPRRALRGLC